MKNNKRLFYHLFTPRNICCGYLLESPRRGDSNKYPQHMFLGVLNTVFLNNSNYLPHLDLRNRSIQIVVVTNFVVILNVGVKMFDCTIFLNISNYLSHIELRIRSIQNVVITSFVVISDVGIKRVDCIQKVYQLEVLFSSR